MSFTHHNNRCESPHCFLWWGEEESPEVHHKIFYGNIIMDVKYFMVDVELKEGNNNY